MNKFKYKATILLFLIVSKSLFSQESDSTNLFFGISSYLSFPANEYMPGVTSIGPTLTLGINRVNVQTGFLYDLHENYIWERKSHFEFEKFKRARFFIPFILHYRYYTTKRFDLTAAAGIFIESRPEFTNVEVYMNPFFGTGVTYKFCNNFRIGAQVNAQGTKEQLMPGLLFDLTYRFTLKPATTQEVE